MSLPLTIISKPPITHATPERLEIQSLTVRLLCTHFSVTTSVAVRREGAGTVGTRVSVRVAGEDVGTE